MDSGFWLGALSWAVTLATAAGSLLFGQLARQSIKRYPPGHVPPAVRSGVVVSITGPIVLAVVGLVVAAVTGYWLYAAVGTFLAVLAVTALGWFLAPR